ncbi:MAG: uncharacterized protein PWQ28_824 [Candidatus Woesearchaeota archaeon]|nr:uncharacterized protein [Candidatus Woesearchaeota archaeon]
MMKENKNNDRRALIVGIDPGTTIGLCIIDFNADLIELSSHRNIKIDSIIRRIIENGKAIVISCDKKKIPEYVNEIRATLGCIVYAPKEDLNVIEKELIIKEFGFDEAVNDSHQRDACASALFAYKRLRQKIDKIRERTGGELPSQEILSGVFINNYNIKKAIDLEEKRLLGLESKGREEKKESERKEKVEERSELNRKEEAMKRELELLEKSNALLKQRLEELSDKKSSEDKNFNKIKEEIKRIIKSNDAEKKLLRLLINDIRKENIQIKRRYKRAREELKSIKDAAVDSSTGFCWYCDPLKKEMIKRMNLERNREIIVKQLYELSNPVIEELKRHDARVFYIEGHKNEIERLRQEGIFVAQIKGVKIRIFNNVACFNAREKEAIIKNKSIIEDIVEEYKRNRTKK